MYIPGLEAAEVVDSIVHCHSDIAVCLFGSRAREDQKPFSDIDLGIYRKKKISLKEFSSLMTMVDDFNEKLSIPTPIQIVNLTSADKDFLEAIREDLVFIGGSMQSWALLLKKAGMILV